MSDPRLDKDPFAFLEEQGKSEQTVSRSLSDSKFGEIDLIEDDEMVDMPFTTTDLGVKEYDGDSSSAVPMSTTARISMEEDIVVPAVSVDMGEEEKIMLSERSDTRQGEQTSGMEAGGVPVQEDYASYPMYSIKRYREYFNVGTSDVLHRILRSVVYFFTGDFLDHVGGNPDLYGPFWIASTLIFISAAAGNMASYIAHDSTDEEKRWYYDVDKVGGSMGLFYGYVGVVGLVVFAVLKYFKSSASLPMIWCIYGYALVSYIPMAALCVIPVESARWALVSVATAISCVFLIRSLQPCVANSEVGVKSTLVLACVLVAHVVLGLSLKLYFFNY